MKIEYHLKGVKLSEQATQELVDSVGQSELTEEINSMKNEIQNCMKERVFR